MTKTKLARALASGRLAITAECRPPRSGDAAAIKKLSAALPSGVDAVVVADNPDKIHGSALACAAILAARARYALSADARPQRMAPGGLGAATLE
jgi:5,10-methylenetetrahydrofolate reductase